MSTLPGWPPVVSLEELRRLLSGSRSDQDRLERRLGPVRFLRSEAGEPACERELLVVVRHESWAFAREAFRFERVETAACELQGAWEWRGGSLHFQVDVGGLLHGVHLLGDYGLERGPTSLKLSRRARQGRFLVLLTADPLARARPLNGWSFEVRSQGVVTLVLHANDAAQMRPLGPVSTDAECAVVEWSQAAPQLTTGRFFQAARIHGGRHGQVDLSSATDLAWQFPT